MSLNDFMSKPFWVSKNEAFCGSICSLFVVLKWSTYFLTDTLLTMKVSLNCVLSLQLCLTSL
jgi:hypothetical protein